MGLSSSKQKTSSSEQSKATTTPNVPNWISSPWQQFGANVGALNPSSMQTVGPTANQNAASTRAGLLGYRGPTSVTPGQLNGTDLSGYMNPFERGVIDTTIADWQYGNDLGLNSLRSQLTRPGSSPSRNNGFAVAAGQFMGDNSRTLANTLANLRSSGFLNAQDRAVSDIDRRFAGDQFNINTGLAADANERANIGLLSDIGTQERAIAQENDPYMQQVRALLMQAGLLSAIPANTFTGQTVDASGSSSSTTKGTPSLLDSIGRIMEIASAAGGKR